MVGIKVTSTHFTGSSKVFTGDDEGLSSVIRKVAQDLARTRISSISDLTDNSTGVGVYPAALAAQSGSSVAAFTETSTASAPKAGFDTAIGKVGDAMAVIAEHINKINAPLGLPLVVDNTGGAVATSGTIPALDKALTAVSSNCLDVVTGRLRLETIKVNIARLSGCANRIAVAIGEPKLTMTALGEGFDGSSTLDAIADSGTAVDGTAASTIADTVVDAELDTIADNIATIAGFLNAIFGAQDTDLTGNTNGTASTTAIAAMTIPATAVDGAATTSSPKAGFDTAIGNIEDALAELAARTNSLYKRNNLSDVLTDNTGVTPNGALPNTAVALTAVDGSSGTNAVDFTTGSDRMGKIRDAVASIAAKVNTLAAIYGLGELTDNSGGTAGSTIDDLAATGTGVGGAGTTILDTVADAFLLATVNNIESLKDKLNAMTGTTNLTDLPLQVVAWDA